jgi:two-component sensor histidine kinase
MHESFRHWGKSARTSACEAGFVKRMPQQALALGMVLHEFATNAAKYRALSASGGAIMLSWRVATYGAGPKLKPAWQESGGPPVETPQRRGLGTRLVERGAPHQLKGDAGQSFPRSGMLRFPRVR